MRVNARMAQRRKPVQGVYAPPARPTVRGGLWLALLVTLPLAALLGLVELILWLV